MRSAQADPPLVLPLAQIPRPHPSAAAGNGSISPMASEFHRNSASRPRWRHRELPAVPVSARLPLTQDMPADPGTDGPGPCAAGRGRRPGRRGSCADAPARQDRLFCSHRPSPAQDARRRACSGQRLARLTLASARPASPEEKALAEWLASSCGTRTTLAYPITLLRGPPQLAQVLRPSGRLRSFPEDSAGQLSHRQQCNAECASPGVSPAQVSYITRHSPRVAGQSPIVSAQPDPASRRDRPFPRPDRLPQHFGGQPNRCTRVIIGREAEPLRACFLACHRIFEKGNLPIVGRGCQGASIMPAPGSAGGARPRSNEPRGKPRRRGAPHPDEATAQRLPSGSTARRGRKPRCSGAWAMLSPAAIPIVCPRRHAARDASVAACQRFRPSADRRASAVQGPGGSGRPTSAHASRG